MWFAIFNVFLTLTHFICIAYGQQNYEIEFLDEGIFRPCEKYPEKFVDRVFDLSHANFEQTDDGSLNLNGYVIANTSMKPPLPVIAEIFKKERGTWQPTLLTRKRSDLCTGIFDNSEVWQPYLKNTPKEQQKCPITKGQRFDFAISEPTIIISVPTRNAEGEYNIHVEVGDTTTGLLLCVEVLVMAYKV